uniref:Uncharacterized protein n=1 Tax=Romanomermis culicivorax TaxID=13658 RepID=A0A915K4I8_ROMCU
MTNKSQNDENNNVVDSEFRWFDLFSLNKDGRNIFTSDILLEISEHLAFVYDNLTCYSVYKNSEKLTIEHFFCRMEKADTQLCSVYCNLYSTCFKMAGAERTEKIR